MKDTTVIGSVFCRTHFIDKGGCSVEIIKSKNDGVEGLRPVGRLDTSTSPLLKEALDEAFRSSESVMLDFSEVAYVSSAALRVLLIGEKSAKAMQKTLTLTNVSSDVMEVFEITGFSGILNISN